MLYIALPTDCASFLPIMPICYHGIVIKAKSSSSLYVLDETRLVTAGEIYVAFFTHRI